MNNIDKLLRNLGWTIKSKSPLEIRDKDGNLVLIDNDDKSKFDKLHQLDNEINHIKRLIDKLHIEKGMTTNELWKKLIK